MKNIYIIYIIIALFINTNINATPVSENGKLRVQGLQLVNACGNPVQLKGVSSHGLQWYGISQCSDVCCATSSALDYLVNTMGIDVFRIAMYVNEGGYLTNPTKFTNDVNQLVDLCGARGIYAIIDWHILTPGDPNASIADARTFWTNMSNTHKGKAHVLYEICNEPNGVSWSTVRNYANDIIPRIRANDPDTVIIVGTPNWSQLGSDVVNNPLSYSNIMYTFHFYAATHSTSLLTPYVGSIPIFCTEWGTCASTGQSPWDYNNATNFLNIMGGSNSAGVLISWCNWSWADKSEGASMLNPGSCGSSNWSNLTTSGQYVRDRIQSPANVWTPCSGGTPTRTRTPTPSPSRTATITPTPSRTSTITPTPSRTLTPTFTRTITVTNTRTPTPTWTRTASVTFSRTVTATMTATNTIFPTFTFTRTSTRTATPTYTRTSTLIITNTATGTQTATPTWTLTFSVTSSITPTSTSSVSPTGTMSATGTSTRTNSPTQTATLSFTRTVTFTVTDTISSNTPTITPTVTFTMTFTPTRTRTPTWILTNTEIITNTFTNTRTETPTYTLTNTSYYSVTHTPTGTQPTATITFTSTQVESATRTATQTSTLTNTLTETPSFTQTATTSATSTSVWTGTWTRTNTPTITSTRTVTGTSTATRTATTSYIWTSTPTLTQTASSSQQPTLALTPTYTETPVMTSTQTTNQKPAISDVVIYPNPYNSKTENLKIKFYITQASNNIKIRIFTTGYRLIKQIIFADKIYNPGTIILNIESKNLNNLANGIYHIIIYAINSDGEESRSKPEEFILLK